MASQAFGAFLEIDSRSNPVTDPAKAVVKDSRPQVQAPAAYELDAIQWGQKLNGPQEIPHVYPNLSDADVELTVPPPTPPKSHVAAAKLQSATNPPRNRWRLVAAAATFFVMGMNDSATGALIPYMEAEYHIGYALVSLIFIANAIGFISAAPLVQPIANRIGRSKAYVAAFTLALIGYIVLACNPPFPLVVLAFLPLGLGYASFLAMTNAWVVNLMNGTTLLGFMHACYGLGGVVAPLIATAMVSKGVRWSFFYLIPMFFVATSIVSMGWFFRGFEQDSESQLLTELEQTASRRAAAEAAGENRKGAGLRRSIQNRTTVLGAIFIFGYQGAEVAISGWIISFLIHFRKGDPSKVGNVTSGFWGGITVGRIFLTHFCHKLGEKTSVYVLVVAAAALQLTVWLIPNIVGNAVAESIVGLFLGPVYPCATAVFSRLLPRNIQLTSLGIIASMGSSGGALAPFLTGLLAQKLGTEVLHPICLVLFVLMELAWFFLPKISKRDE